MDSNSFDRLSHTFKAMVSVATCTQETEEPRECSQMTSLPQKDSLMASKYARA